MSKFGSNATAEQVATAFKGGITGKTGISGYTCDQIYIHDVMGY
jgi:hypothetical protein